VLIWRATHPARFFPVSGVVRLAVRRPRRFSRSLSLGRDGASPAIVQLRPPGPSRIFHVSLSWRNDYLQDFIGYRCV
jgi:hypothetical protein